MDSSGATVPLIVLGVAVLALIVLAVAAGMLLRPGRPPSAAAQETLPATPRAAVADDLPAFRAHPPGSPGAPVRPPAAGDPVRLATSAGSLSPAPTAARLSPVPGRDEGLELRRFLLALAALALVLIAAAAAVAAAAPPARADRPATPPSISAARLSFDAVVLEQQAVGVTMTRPTAGLSTDGRRALLHLRLPTWNCLAPDVPDDPAAAGCVPSVTEYGDLRSPALSPSPDGKATRIHGRVPTYTRPNGGGPTDTGHVYDVTLTVTPGRGLGAGRYVAQGALTLGSATAHTDGDPTRNVLTRGR